MVVVNPKNWHWVEKNTIEWTKQYFETEFIPFVYDADKYVVEIVSIGDIKGDSNVSQRKGKVICYFDLKIDFSVKVSTKDNEDDVIDFKLDIPEFMHDEDDFLIEYLELNKSHDSYKVLSEEFRPVFLKKLLKYQEDLIGSHSKEIQE
ncbi:hypothetical protein QEN19_000189 [Hanseniaspora menglaensis]